MTASCTANSWQLFFYTVFIKDVFVFIVTLLRQKQQTYMTRATTGKTERTWITLSLINLAIVAVLGVLLRSTALFSLPGIHYNNLLFGHSHFALGGWITLCLFALMTYRLLPESSSSKPVYSWLLGGVYCTSLGMLFSFPLQGYAFFSILFSTLFILCTGVFSVVFIKDLLKAGRERAVTLLAAASLVSLVLSAVGPFSLAYMMASHQVNTVLYHDAVYTYLHLQYNGFFTLAVFALFCYHLRPENAEKIRYRFALALCAAVLPTAFLSYLWHQPPVLVRVIGAAGCGLLLLTLARFAEMVRSVKTELKMVNSLVRNLGILALTAFVLKTVAQLLIIFPAIGDQVFVNRPLIISYLHLVMLGFVTLYLLAQLLYTGFFARVKMLAGAGICVFTLALVANEIILLLQGMPGLVSIPAERYPWLLWIAAWGLLAGALLIALAAVRYLFSGKSLPLLSME